jgi:glycosyltransferase involved in cell wall biosynthesis
LFELIFARFNVRNKRMRVLRQSTARKAVVAAAVKKGNSRQQQTLAHAFWWWRGWCAALLVALIAHTTGIYFAPLRSSWRGSGGLQINKSSVSGREAATATTTSAPSPPATPKACLAMIIKNEGPILPRLFASVKGFVSEYCIVDTGSTDDTINVVKSMRMPGVIVEEPFVDFATTRNFMLDTCWTKTDCDYLVLLDADMVLKVSPEWEWRKLDNKDVYDMIQVSESEYYNIRMLRRTTSKDVRVVGSTHEYYHVPPARQFSHKLLPKRLVYIDDVGDGKAKADKYERDERLLRVEVENDPNNTRAVFYLANTLRDRRKYAEAIPFYERRASMGGWQAEVDYSLFMLSKCYAGLDDLTKAREYAEEAAYRQDHQRAEPFYYLAFYLHTQQEYEMAWCYAGHALRIKKPDTTRALFSEVSIYDYWVEYERASLCWLLGGRLSRDYCGRLAHAFLNGNKHAPQSLREYFIDELKRHHNVVADDGLRDLLDDEWRRKHNVHDEDDDLAECLLHARHRTVQR